MTSIQDDDMYLFQGDIGPTPGSYAGQTFDSFLDASATADPEDVMNNDFLNPDDLAMKQEHGINPRLNTNSARASTSSTSSSSSSDSTHHHNRNISTATTSPAMAKTDLWDTGINGMSMPMNEQYFEDVNMAGLDQDLDQQMASAFDFDTAASTPSGYDSAALNSGKGYLGNQQMRRTANLASINAAPSTSTMSAAPAAFFLGSREASPMNTMLPTSQTTSPWMKHSPSSGLEETFHHMGMNGDSPGNATFSPNTMHVNYPDPQFAFHHDSSGTPSSFTKDISSPPSTVHSMDGQPTLHIQPTSLKSRVETQIPIKMTLYPVPTGVKKLRLPTHTVSKPKFLAKPEVERSPDTLELSVMLVCTSAMQDPHRKRRALARARGEDWSAYTRPSPASSHSGSSRDDEEKPLNGGEVKICTGCIQRERKRASRKKQKKPEEEEMFQKDEEKRVVVFNTSEVKEWLEITREGQTADQSPPSPPPGTMHVELPMRIACYCRHQNEKLGFQVIFTIKDYRDKVIAQAMTNSIMITDDHKTHNAPQPLPVSQPSQMPQPSHLPGAGVFATGGIEPSSNEAPGAKLFKQSYSTPDLTRLQHGFSTQFGAPNNNPFAIPSAISGTTSGTLTPRNLSRPASPSGPSGPATKRRKPSGSGKLPSGLTMTRLDTMPMQSSGSATMPSTTASSPYTHNMPNFVSGPDRNFQPTLRAQTFGQSPPTPGGDGTFNSSINRSFSLENLPRQALISAPSSRQPSRPGSPLAGQSHNNFGQNDPSFTQAVNNQLMGSSSRRPTPVIHKLVPAEGSTSGGTEVTLLGNGFHQGLEVMFGDTEATTTTFWGEKCLNCIAPPAVQAGMVSVMFKHEHPHYSAIPTASHVRHSIFTYVDDRELEMLRLALRTIGKQMGTDDPYTAAQQLLQQTSAHSNGAFPQSAPYGTASGHQRGVSAQRSHGFEPHEMELCLIRMLYFAEQQIRPSALQLDLRRPTGLTLLHLAASLSMPLFVTALLAVGADPNVLDNNGFSPMHHAAMNGNEVIIDRLRAQGGDHRLRSLRSFIPADLATTLQAYQATMRPYQHSRSRSQVARNLSLSSHNNSSKSLSSFWEDSSIPSTDSESERADDTSAASSRKLPYVQPKPFSVTHSRQPSRRGSRHQDLPSQALVQTTEPIPEQAASSLMNAWRQIVNMTQAQQVQLTEQLQHLQENFPIPDYQNNAMMRRMSAFFPQWPVTNTDGNVREGWWDTFKRSSSPTSGAPPSYDELYPNSSQNTDAGIKKELVTQAAADAAIDEHFSRQEQSSQQTLWKNSTPQILHQETQNIQRVGIRQDLKLFVFWVPLLIILLALMLRGSPVSSAVTSLTAPLFQREVVEVV